MKNKILALLGLFFIAAAIAAPDIEFSLLFLLMGVGAVMTANYLFKEILSEKDDDGWISFYGVCSPFNENTRVEYFTNGWKNDMNNMSDDVVWKNVVQYRVIK